MEAIMVWALIANYHPVNEPLYLGQFASKAVCEQVGKIQQRERDKINRGQKDPRGPVFVDGHSMSYECMLQTDWDKLVVNSKPWNPPPRIGSIEWALNPPPSDDAPAMPATPAIRSWVLIADYNPVNHPRDLGQFASKAVCEQVGKIKQRENDKMARGQKDPPRSRACRRPQHELRMHASNGLA